MAWRRTWIRSCDGLTGSAHVAKPMNVHESQRNAEGTMKMGDQPLKRPTVSDVAAIVQEPEIIVMSMDRQ